MVFCDKKTGFVDERRAVDAVGLDIHEQGFIRHCGERQQELGWGRVASSCLLYL